MTYPLGLLESFTLVIPTSTTITPFFTISPLRNPGTPKADITISAVLVNDSKSFVLL